MKRMIEAERRECEEDSLASSLLVGTPQGRSRDIPLAGEQQNEEEGISLSIDRITRTQPTLSSSERSIRERIDCRMSVSVERENEPTIEWSSINSLSIVRSSHNLWFALSRSLLRDSTAKKDCDWRVGLAQRC